MSRVIVSLSVVFGIFCLSSFKIVDDERTPLAKTPEIAASEAVASVCEHQLFEYFYTSSERFKLYCDSAYKSLFNEQNRPTRKVFDFAMKGYAYCLSQNLLTRSEILTFIDYSLSSNKKRMWVLDLKQMKVVFHELVAHGRNTGLEFAKKFSNTTNSFQSSLGFFVTGEIYDGKHNTSIKMNGIEKKFNGKALDRGIVIHGADYVSEDFIKTNQRLGRSLGCPAVSEAVISDLSSTIAGGTCIFSYFPNKTYLKSSRILNSDVVFSRSL